LPAQAGELAHPGLERGGVGLADIGAGLEVRRPFAQEPADFAVARALGLAAAAGAQRVR
jgi:hypothetical protein